MSPFNDTTIAHIRKSVVSHGFCDPADWSLGLEELSYLDESDIDALVTDPAKRLPLGVTPEIAKHDRELFNRANAATGDRI